MRHKRREVALEDAKVRRCGVVPLLLRAEHIEARDERRPRARLEHLLGIGSYDACHLESLTLKLPPHA